MNSWNFTGNLGQDAETRFTRSGDAVVSFSVAVKSGYGDKEKITWARCSMFGKRGEAVAPYLNKGQLVGINGEVTLNDWTDRDGMKRTSLEVRVNDLTLLGKRDGSGAQSDGYTPQQQSQSTQRPAQQQSGGSFDNMGDDIPFN